MIYATVTEDSALLSSTSLRARGSGPPPDITVSPKAVAFRCELRRNGTPLEVIAEGTLPDWLEGVLQQLQGLLDLKDDWDAEGAPRVSIDSVCAVVDVLCEIAPALTPAPSLVPTAEGCVQIEWHRGGIDLEIEVVSRLRATAYLADLATGEEWEGDLEARAPEIRKRLARMSS
ncbi:MAG: hypothetical protein GY719_15225 [bacterium]|nr:hypothetical protein [bacterium]